MPKAVFCIHALSLYMFKLGSAPQIEVKIVKWIIIVYDQWKKCFLKDLMGETMSNLTPHKIFEGFKQQTTDKLLESLMAH